MGNDVPWYRRVLRWGQTNVNELDPTRYDIAWWRQYWKRTHVQGVIINAGGIVAYYPSKLPHHYRAKSLGDRDLYGELTRAAHGDGLAVLARMDSNRASEAFYQAHPDWFAVDLDGRPYRAGDRYISCIDSPYYSEYLLEVLREIIRWERPEGFTDNSWSGLDRDQICYCKHSRDSFRRATGKELPTRKDWDDPVWREWVLWSYARRVEVWDLNNRATKDAGGPDCLWMGMLSGDFTGQGRRCRDVKAICERAEIIMLDDQGRSDASGFQRNAELGLRLHGLLGWDKLMPESMATYQRNPTFRRASATAEESRMWMYSGFAGGIQPWWHHVGAYQWDRRQFQTTIPVFEWHARNERYLMGRRPAATVGVVYSQRNADFFGRDDAEERVGLPYYGVIQALVRGRVPYIPVEADHIDRFAADLALLVLPNLGSMTAAQTEAVRRFAARGGGILATGETSLYDEWGTRRGEFALADVLGVSYRGRRHGSGGEAESWTGTDHSYLRLHPDVGGQVYGPKSDAEPATSGPRHEVLRGFDQTDTVAFGGMLIEVRAAPGMEVPLTFVPHFPAYPPEFAWTEIPRTQIPASVLGTGPAGGRCSYLAADIDRRFARDILPDHGDLLVNLIRWTARDRIPLQVRGSGLIDCHLWRQDSRLILHMVNLTSTAAWRSPVDELIQIGPIEVRLRLPEGNKGDEARLLVADKTLKPERQGEWVAFSIAAISDHEVAVVE